MHTSDLVVKDGAMLHTVDALGCCQQLEQLILLNQAEFMKPEIVVLPLEAPQALIMFGAAAGTVEFDRCRRPDKRIFQQI